MLPNEKTVLVVDDKECIRSSMSLVLAELWYSVSSAEDGVSALRVLEDWLSWGPADRSSSAGVMI